MWAFAHLSRLRRETTVRSRPSMQMSFPETVSDSLCRNSLVMQTINAEAVRVAGLSRSWRWRCWMWRSWAGVVTRGRGLRLWGRLYVLPNSLKRLWRWLMVERLTKKENVLDLWLQLMKNVGQKQKCCVYNFVQYNNKKVRICKHEPTH